MSTDDLIRGLEARRYDAMAAGDFAALRELLSDRLTYAHSDATRDTKATYLATLADGSLRYLKTWHETERVIALGDSAAAIGRMGADIVRNGSARTIGSITLALWAKEGDAWRLVAYQPTALPPSTNRQA
ncbi:nuclear transport factor 2 family protein [Roseomonas sp. CCTCC AB2023176]|uniref:nuclear transport factor 2 family protein n=1 Tax=Roseomonas sp. CCTCC AB2023176 TaxID=3342640 RepID=UPI0035DC5FCD